MHFAASLVYFAYVLTWNEMEKKNENILSGQNKAKVEKKLEISGCGYYFAEIICRVCVRWTFC